MERNLRRALLRLPYDHGSPSLEPPTLRRGDCHTRSLWVLANGKYIDKKNPAEEPGNPSHPDNDNVYTLIVTSCMFHEHKTLVKRR